MIEVKINADIPNPRIWYVISNLTRLELLTDGARMVIIAQFIAEILWVSISYIVADI